MSLSIDFLTISRYFWSSSDNSKSLGSIALNNPISINSKALSLQVILDKNLSCVPFTTDSLNLSIFFSLIISLAVPIFSANSFLPANEAVVSILFLNILGISLIWSIICSAVKFILSKQLTITSREEAILSL